MSNDEPIREMALKVREYWQSIRVKVRPGASEEALQTFEAEHQVVIPDDFRTFLSVVDGMEAADLDNQPSEWIALERVTDVPSYLDIGIHDEILAALSEPQEWFVFQDYLASSHAYAVRFRPVRHPTTPVLWLGSPDYSPLADTFSEYLAAYLSDPENVPFPPDV